MPKTPNNKFNLTMAGNALAPKIRDALRDSVSDVVQRRKGSEMKYIYFNKELTDKNVIELINEITENTVIYLESIGGEITAANIFIHFTQTTEFEITLVATWKVESCAIDMFLFSKTKKVVLDCVFGLIHTINKTLELKNINRKEEMTMYQIALVEKENAEKWNKYTEMGLNKELYNKYYSGDDLIISVDTLKTMAERAEKKYYYGEQMESSKQS